MTQDILKPFRHQAQLMALPFARPDIGKFFLVGGYGCAKTSALKLLTMKLIETYWKYPVVGALGAPTITFLEKTLVTDLRSTLNSTGSVHRYDAGKHVLKIGSMEIRMLATGQPGDIYGHNLSFFLGDEHDENSQDKAIESNTAIDERCRVDLPDGRPPFSVLATTAQGLKGLYRIVEASKEQYAEDPTVKYALIRGRTRDNTSLKESYIRRLEATYTEEERRAYLDGEFVNLTAGRVYYAYNEGNPDHYGPVEPVQPNETVYVGQDLNEGYSKATACVVRDRRVIVVRDFSFKAIGQAPRLLREAFPHNRIVWYPDNSGKPILGGYVEEIEHYGIETVYAGRNPSILDRIFIVNKMFAAGRLQVAKECKDTSMALKTRQFDEKGVPEKGKGPTAPDHLNDSMDYVIFRLVADHEEFMDLYELTPASHKEQ